VIDERFRAIVQAGRDRWLSFRDPCLVLRADSAHVVTETIAEVERLTRDRGWHAVGFIAYEAGAAFGLPVMNARAAPDVPLAWFAFYDDARVETVPRPAARAAYRIGTVTPSMTRDQFERAFVRVREHLAAGNSYQANLTFQLVGDFQGDAFSLFADLAAVQRGSYSAFIDLGEVAICSASPELFFEIEGLDVSARPMKGTARRGRTNEDDRAAGEALAASEKNRAENVMIVDMIRNDLGRVAEVGSVEVPALFAVERYPNVWQMTSTVRARSTASLAEMFAALHPSASITGAPKRRTMEILREVESTPRGIYTGAIGYVPSDGDARFSVAIRTAVVDRRAGRMAFGVGSGIVWDSDAGLEYAECLLKASVLGQKPIDFELLETLRWAPGEGYVLLERHLARLRGSAEYFDVPLSSDGVRQALDRAVAGAEGAQRVRLLVGRDGAIRTERRPHVSTPAPLRVGIAPAPIDPADVFLYHKTTNRAVYERARAAVAGVDDVILWNPSGDVTEATTANVVADIDGVRVTPPVECGLLPGTCRAEMLAAGGMLERRITLDDLRRATRLWLINAVHGARTFELGT
jgi:para-aminobenzoate synthetase/4-amino-4-deoxychorismate lyase